MARQIASDMRRIHQHGMIHRDIRPDNILINDDYNAKIGDMGIARVLDPAIAPTQIGCQIFMLPEFYQKSNGRVKYNEKLDIFTYGLTLNQLFTEILHHGRFGLPGSRITITKQIPNAFEIEKMLELYEQAFIETTFSKNYTKLNANENDKVFLEFYQKNKSTIQRFIQEFIKKIKN